MGRPIRALIVEDDSEMRFLLTRILTRLNAQLVEAAASAEEGLGLLANGDHTLMLTDVGLKGAINGIDLVKRLRSDVRHPLRAIPILVLTGNQQMTVLKAALAAGVDGFVMKPVSPATLATHIDRVMNHRSPMVSMPDYFGPDRRAVVRI